MTACHVNINNKGKEPAAADEAALTEDEKVR
jgi:hypothetical protein